MLLQVLSLLFLLRLIGCFQFLTGSRRLSRGYYSNRLLQCEGQDPFGRELDVGFLAGRLNPATRARTGNAANGGAFAAAKNSAKNCARHCSTANFGSGILAARSGFLLEVVGLDVIPAVPNFDSVQLQLE